MFYLPLKKSLFHAIIDVVKSEKVSDNLTFGVIHDPITAFFVTE